MLSVAVGALADGAQVAVSGGNDETIRVWRLDDGTRVGEPLQLGGPVRSVAWCQSEQLVLAAGAFGLAALQLR